MRGKTAKRLRRIAKTVGEEKEYPPVAYAGKKFERIMQTPLGPRKVPLIQIRLDHRCIRYVYQQLKTAWKTTYNVPQVAEVGD